MDLDLEKIERFDWDSGNLDHIKKHNVVYTECEEVINNGPFANEDKEHSKVEIRHQALGQTNSGRFLFISFTIQENKIRVISARDQSKRERASEKGGEPD